MDEHKFLNQNTDSAINGCPIMPTYGAPTKQFIKGEGAYLYDNNGKKYLDFLCGLAVTSLGHSHKQITDVASHQINELVHLSNLFSNQHHGELANTIDNLIGNGTPSGGQTFFCNSGAEANEAAIKLARKFGNNKKFEIISAEGGFHGRTLGSLAATGQPKKWEGFAPLPTGFKHVEYNNIEALEGAITDLTCAVLLEPIQGEGGVHPATREYFQSVRELCDQNQILFIVDEVQTGFGRTGEWFGFQNFDVQPDVVTMAKALGNGIPIGACWAKPEVAACFGPGDHGSTFGGQPFASSIARTVIQIMKDIDAPALVQNLSAQISKQFLELNSIKEIRGFGLLLGLELTEPIAKEAAARCLENGLIVNAVTDSALRIAPPFIIDETQIEEAAEILQESI